MPVRIPAILEISDESLAALVGALPREDMPPAVVALAAPPAAPAGGAGAVAPGAIELPAGWDLVGERQSESYTWPGENGPVTEDYDPFRIYAARTSAGSIQMAIGHCERSNTWGQDRRYLITFALGTGGGSKRPLCEFLATDNFESTREMVAIIRGSDGGRRMYDPTATLPPAYNTLRVETYRDHIDYPGSWRKLAVVAHVDDAAAMLNHSLIQAQSRFGIGPT